MKRKEEEVLHYGNRLSENNEIIIEVNGSNVLQKEVRDDVFGFTFL